MNDSIFTEVFRREPDNSAPYVKYASHQSLEGALYLLPTIIYPCLDMSVDWIVKEYEQGKMQKMYIYIKEINT